MVQSTLKNPLIVSTELYGLEDVWLHFWASLTLTQYLSLEV